MRHSRRGFTLIELLVVIGIILILVSLLVVGYRHINATTAKNETRAELHVCQQMLQEYEGRNGLRGIEFYSLSAPPQQVDPNGPAVETGAPVAPNYPGFPIFLDPWPSLNTMVQPANVNSNTKTFTGSGGAAGTYWPCLRLDASQNDVGLFNSSTLVTDMGDKTDTTSQPSPRYHSNAVEYTDEVMYVLAEIPANRTTMQSLQSKRILELPSGQTQWMTQGPPSVAMSFPPVVLLDGWGNPIIFVPRGGMHVYIMNQATKVNDLWLVRSTGTNDLGPATSPTADPPMTGNERPFWASAGQDGDFTLGEDNIYSFQQ